MPASSPPTPVEPGDVIAGKYEVERVLGSGGMGIVFAAHHVALAERVAIKMLLPEAVKSPDVRARFLREAQASVRIRSEHVARVMDVGETERGLPYMVMEFLEGEDLGALVATRGWLTPGEAVDYVLQACEAVAEAHARGIVHRDLKPANLFLTRRADGSALVKVLDFGVSKPVSDEGSRGVTTTGRTLGSPMYMSPEQVRDARSVDTRTDVWSLGVLLYELLSGKAPFEGASVTGLLAAIVTDPPQPLPAGLAVPPGLEAVIFRCLEKDRERRVQDVAELAAALLPFASESARVHVERIQGMLVQRAPAPVPSEPSLGGTSPRVHGGAPEASSTLLDSTINASSRGRGRGLLLVLAGVALGVGGVGLALSLSARAPSSAQAEPSRAPVATLASAPPEPTASAITAVAPAPSAVASTAPSAATSVAPRPTSKAAAKPTAHPAKPSLGSAYDSRK
jgi:serine/threonine-protein kinase